MRVNVYAEEMTDRVEVISKRIDGQDFTGLRIYLELPVTMPLSEHPEDVTQVKGPFMHRPGDDDSSAVTFWGKKDLREVLKKALAMLDEHYAGRAESQKRGNWTKDAYDRWIHGNGAVVMWSVRRNGYACFGPGSMTAQEPKPFDHRLNLEDALLVAQSGPVA